MHNAPPVAFPVGRFVWGYAVIFSLAVCGAIGLVVWQSLTRVSPSLVWAAWLFGCVCVLASLYWAPRQTLSGGRLFWSGESWYWQAADEPQQCVELSVCVDLNTGLWLVVQRLDESGQPHGHAAYAWVQARTMPSKWHGFRCAVYSVSYTHLTLPTICSV